MVHVLDFRGCAARVVSADVLSALARVAGDNLRSLDLRRCSKIRVTDVEEILRYVRVSCRNVHTVDITGCDDQVCLRAVAICAQLVFAVASPRERQLSNAQGAAGGRFPLHVG